MVLLFWGVSSAFLSSCSDSTDTEEADQKTEEEWKAANDLWYKQVADSARAAIAAAKAQYGDKWEENCEWRMYKDILTAYPQSYTDSICVRINNLHEAKDPDQKGSPSSTDSVRVTYRGYSYCDANADDAFAQINNPENPALDVFDQTYYGKYNPETASSRLMSVENLVSGFMTAMEYMVEGDDWYVYMPQNLGYGSSTSSSSSISDYSTLLFRIHMIKWYESGSGIPDWMSRDIVEDNR